MRSRRRIFRSSLSPARRFPTTLVLLLASTVGTAALVMTGLSSDLFGRSPPPPAHIVAGPEAVAVVDGDTLVLAGQTVRLRGIEAPDRGDLCVGQVDCGRAATSALAELVRDRRVECALDGQDRRGRPVADCRANGTDLSQAIVARGWARATSNAPELADSELRARQRRAGLWADASAL